MTSGWRYHALRILDRTWLHRDLPLSAVSISPALSGPGSMAATLDPDTFALRADDGTPLLQEWRDLIIAEASDEIRFAGILVNSLWSGQSWQLDIAGVSAWPQGQPQVATLIYGDPTHIEPNGPVSGEGADPLRIARDLWTQLQSQPDADLRVGFGGSTASGYRMAHWYGVSNRYDYRPDASTTVTVVPYDTTSADDVKTYEQVQVDVAGTSFLRITRSALDPVPSKSPTAKPGPYWQYYLYNYDTTDVGAKINDLAKNAPFDYIEYAAWSDSDKSDVDLRIDFGAPRLGTRQSSLRFVEGENISDLVTVRQDGEDYANGVMVVGAGDGADQLRQTLVQRDGRLRRVKVVTASGISDFFALRGTVLTQLNLINKLTDLQQFTVRQHPHAPYGSYRVGDDILVQVTTGWAAGTSLWVRITALTYQPDSESVQVTCTRSDSFSYGSTNLS